MRHFAALPGAWGLVVLLFATSVAADPPGDRLIDEVTRAYDQARQYDAEVGYTMVERNGAWLNKLRGTIFVAWDRDQNRLKIDDPDFIVVVDGDTMRARLHSTPGQYVEHAGYDPVAWEKLVSDVPVLSERVPMDVVLAFATDPVSVLSGGFSSAATLMDPDPDDPQQRRRLRFNTDTGRITFLLGNDTPMIEEAVIELGGRRGGNGRAIVLTYDIKRHNEALPDDLFAFDTTNATKLASFFDLNPNAGGAGGGAGGGMAGGGSNPPPPMKLPEIALPVLGADKTVRFADIEEPVTVLAFFTTWAPPCGPQVKQVNAFFETAQEQKLPVAVYLVNMFEQPEAVQAVVDQVGITAPVLMDTEGAAAGDLGVLTLPQTLVIHHGKVVGRYPQRDDLARQLEQDVKRLADSPPPADAEPKLEE